MTKKGEEKPRFKLRFRSATWYNQKESSFKNGFEILLPGDVILLQKVGKTPFRGPSYLLSLLQPTDDEYAVKRKLQAWVNQHEQEVALELSKHPKGG